MTISPPRSATGVFLRVRARLPMICLTIALLLALPVWNAPVHAQELPKAYLNIIIDDYRNLDLWLRLADDCETHGFPATLALDTGKVAPEDWNKLRHYTARGHEIASHTVHHVPLALDEAIGVSYYDDNAKSAFLTVDAQARRVRAYVDGAPDPVFDIDTSLTGPCPSMRDLVRKINTYPGFSAELLQPTYANIRAQFLADAEEMDIFFKRSLTPLTIEQYDHDLYELRQSKEDIETNIPGYVCRSVAYPFLINDSLVRQVARELRYAAGRTGPNGNWRLSDRAGYNIYEIWAVKPGNVLRDAADPAAFAQKAGEFLTELKRGGGMGCLYSHGPDEFTNEQWKALLDIIARDKEVKVVTLGEMRDMLDARYPHDAEGVFATAATP